MVLPSLDYLEDDEGADEGCEGDEAWDDQPGLRIQFCLLCTWGGRRWVDRVCKMDSNLRRRKLQKWEVGVDPLQSWRLPGELKSCYLANSKFFTKAAKLRLYNFGFGVLSKGSQMLRWMWKVLTNMFWGDACLSQMLRRLWKVLTNILLANASLSQMFRRLGIFPPQTGCFFYFYFFIYFSTSKRMLKAVYAMLEPTAMWRTLVSVKPEDFTKFAQCNLTLHNLGTWAKFAN